jgi:hypothetical protein
MSAAQVAGQVLGAMGSGDAAGLEALLAGLAASQPALLADMVLAHMPLLPPALPPAFRPPPPAPGGAAQDGAPAGRAAAAAAAAAAAVAAASAAVAAGSTAPLAPLPMRGVPPAAGLYLPGGVPARTPTPPPLMAGALAGPHAYAAPLPGQPPQPVLPPPQPVLPPPQPVVVVAAPPATARPRGPLPPLKGPARPPEAQPSFAGGKPAAAAVAPGALPPLRPARMDGAAAAALQRSALRRLLATALPPGAPGRRVRQVR